MRNLLERMRLSFIFIFFLGTFGLSFSNDKAQDLPNLFPFKSAIVEYEVIYPGDTTKVQRTLYIDEYGKNLCMDYRIFSRGEKRFIYIFTKDRNFAINMNMKVAAKRKNPSELFDEEALGDWFKEVLYGNRLKNIMNPERFKGVERILDIECNIYDHGEDKYWIWNNLILKWERKDRIENAKKIQLNVSVPPERFQVPKGIWVFPKIF